ncbi:Uncharacterised protein [Neisseria zoodegmatis]|uniref:Uncharacterized protein n=1 Tax=Neisseria zoodegmatis TaxID=326523 RepID=A0A378WHE9_9NEIS|nr:MULTISPECIES: hypothetical protein [Neisseria]SUA36337.1 Uncharacterised protein [Neisseria zoodegmatis]
MMEILIRIEDKPENPMEVVVTHEGMEYPPEKFSMAYLIGQGMIESVPQVVETLKAKVLDRLMEEIS